MLSRGGCQPGLVMAKCMSDNSVFPSSACWYTEASVCPPDSHCAWEKTVSRSECLQQPFLEDSDNRALSYLSKP